MLIVKYYIFPGVMVPYRSSCQQDSETDFKKNFQMPVYSVTNLNVCRYVCLAIAAEKEILNICLFTNLYQFS